MVKSIQRDIKRRISFSKNELKRIELKCIINDLSISKDIRYNCMRKLNELSRNSSIVRKQNRCILTGRGRSVSRFCGLSRIKFRELAGQGLIMGVTKSSW